MTELHVPNFNNTFSNPVQHIDCRADGTYTINVNGVWSVVTLRAGDRICLNSELPSGYKVEVSSQS